MMGFTKFANLHYATEGEPNSKHPKPYIFRLMIALKPAFRMQYCLNKLCLYNIHEFVALNFEIECLGQKSVILKALRINFK